MKIAWADNPLNTKVVLDEHDRQVLRLKVKVDDLLDRIGDGDQQQQHGKNVGTLAHKNGPLLARTGTCS